MPQWQKLRKSWARMVRIRGYNKTLMEDVHHSVERIPLEARAILLKELLCLDQEQPKVVAIAVQSCQALPCAVV